MKNMVPYSNFDTDMFYELFIALHGRGLAMKILSVSLSVCQTRDL